MAFSDLTRDGRLSLAVGTASLGLFNLIWGNLNPGLQPPLEWLGQGQFLAYASGGLLLIIGLALFAPRLVRMAGFALGAFWLAWLVLGNSVQAFPRPQDVTAWVSLSEVAGIAVAAFLVAASHYGPARAWLRLAARGVTGLMLVWFGVVHLMYRSAIAGMIPAWMPLHDLWPWLTGAALIAAGAGLITGVKGKLAGTLAGVMFASWIALVHIPRLLAQPGSREEWTALGLNLALIGVVWITGAGAFRKPV